MFILLKVAHWSLGLAISGTLTASFLVGLAVPQIKSLITPMQLLVCSTMVSIRYVGVSERQSEDSFVCFDAKPTQRACARDYRRDRKKTRQGKARQGHRAEQKGVSDSQGKATVREKQLLKEELGLVDPEAGSASARGWISVPSSCVGISFGYTPTIATDAQKSQKSAKYFSLLTLIYIYIYIYIYIRKEDNREN